MHDHCQSTCRFLSIFFFKQKTAYEIMPSLVGSEMCIRDRLNTDSDESWHTLCVQLLNVCLCLPLHTPRSFAQQRSMPKCTMIVSQLVAFYPFFLKVFFFIGCDPQMYTVGGHQISIWSVGGHQISIWSTPTQLYHN